MVTAQDLCLRLGFIKDDMHSRGDPNALLTDVRRFAATLTENSDPEWATHRYLHTRGRGPAHWPSNEDAELEELLQWPKTRQCQYMALGLMIV